MRLTGGDVTGVEASARRAPPRQAISASREELRRARIAAVLQAFFIGAALMVGAAVAWLTAVEGGKDRETGDFVGWPRR